MTGLDVRYIGKSRIRTSDGKEWELDPSFAILPRAVLEPIGMAALRRVARDLWTRDGHLLDLMVADVPVERFDPEKVFFRDIAEVRLVMWADDDIEVVFPTGHDVDDPDDYTRWIPKILAPLLRRRRATLSDVGIDPADSTDSTVVVRIQVPWRGKTVAQALRVGDEARALVKAVDGGSLDLATTADLVRTGYSQVLLDQAEGPWLDGKQAPYQLDTDVRRLEFAKDVASFANARDGGLIVIGARTEKTEDGDVIRSIKEVDLTLASVPQLSSIARDRIFPPIEGLEICRIDHGDNRGLIMIYVPPQAASRKPFLVRGAAIEGKVRTAYMSLPVREGEDVRWTDLPTLHGVLQAGQLANALTEDSVREKFVEATQVASQINSR